MINLENLNLIKNTILKYHSAELMVVTKNRSIEDISELIKLNFSLFGENKVQEAKNKFDKIDRSKIKLHLIGPLQSNKTKDALKIFDTIQSIDRPKIIQEIFKYKDEKVLTKDFYIQVNIGKEEQKSGVLPEDLYDLYNLARNFNFNITGLMCIPPNDGNPKKHFQHMFELKNSVNSNFKLSMGMSSDYEIALQQKSDLIRVGSLIFNA